MAPKYAELIPTAIVDDPRDTEHLGEILKRADALIDPAIDCSIDVRSSIWCIRYAAHCPYRSSAQIKDETEDLYLALKKVKSAIDNLSPSTWFKLNYDTPFSRWLYRHTVVGLSQMQSEPIGISWWEFTNDVLAKIAFIEKIKFPTYKGAPRLNLPKLTAAAHSHGLLSRFGKKSPTLTIGGPFYELASILYEGATYIADANLERYCRTIRAIAKG